MGLVAIVAAAGGCASVASAPTQQPSPRQSRPLVVGMAADSPPFAFRREDQLVGLEVDLARRVGDVLKSTVDVQTMRWDALVPALLAGRIDVIMSGMTITALREVRVAFTDPYLQSGLLALMRRADQSQFSSPAAIKQTTRPIGVVKNTTSETWATQNCPVANVLFYPTIGDAVTELGQRKLVVVIGDAPIVVWMASRTSELVVLQKMLDREQIGWATRREDSGLRQALNDALARMKADGSLAQIVDLWIPFWKKLEVAGES
jgi:ABC-type amino acid transport substrate-binding protein